MEPVGTSLVVAGSNLVGALVERSNPVEVDLDSNSFTPEVLKRGLTCLMNVINRNYKVGKSML